MRPVPPAGEVALGLASYLTTEPGIGGKLRTEPEDFVVLETGDAPPVVPEGAHAAARIRLRNWETNRFIGTAAQLLRLHRDQIGFAGMKDKRAVTEQWFSFKCPVSELDRLATLQDVEILERHATRKAHFTGAHEGNAFKIRVRETTGAHGTVESVAATIQREGGVPNFFGPQRFGGHFRPITHLVGASLVAGDLEETVRLYVGHPMPHEHQEAQAARRVYDETRDPAAALAVYPSALDPERAILYRLTQRPGDFRYALQALPHNLLQLFVHAHQSWLFNLIVSERVAAGLGLRTAHVGDLVIITGEDGTRAVPVVEANVARVQKELDKGRATLTAPLVGLDSALADGAPGDIERRVLAAHKVEPRAFRIRELPELASKGRRRGILQDVAGLAVAWDGDDPVFSFQLGRGAYATVVLREFMKAPLADY